MIKRAVISSTFSSSSSFVLVADNTVLSLPLFLWFFIVMKTCFLGCTFWSIFKGSLRMSPWKRLLMERRDEVHSPRALKGSVESKTAFKFLLLKAHPLYSCPPVYVRRPCGHYWPRCCWKKDTFHLLATSSWFVNYKVAAVGMKLSCAEGMCVEMPAVLRGLPASHLSPPLCVSSDVSASLAASCLFAATEGNAALWPSQISTSQVRLINFKLARLAEESRQIKLQISANASQESPWTRASAASVQEQALRHAGDFWHCVCLSSQLSSARDSFWNGRARSVWAAYEGTESRKEENAVSEGTWDREDGERKKRNWENEREMRGENKRRIRRTEILLCPAI